MHVADEQQRCQSQQRQGIKAATQSEGLRKVEEVSTS